MKSSLLNKIAKSNKKLSNDHYKQMIKNSSLIHNKTSIKVFKEAFHSKETPTDYRVILLSSLYKDRPNFSNLIRIHAQIPPNTTKLALSPEVGKDGKKHFELLALRKATFLPQGGYTVRPPYKVTLSMKIKEHIRNGEPKNLAHRLLNKALQSNNVQFQKATIAMQNISRCLFDLAKLAKSFAFGNDPLGIFNTSPTDGQKELGKAAYETGFFRQSAELYLKDVSHTYKELEKYMPILDKMGIDTLLVKLEYDNIKTSIEEFILGRGIGDADAEVTNLYELHRSSGSFIESALDIAQQVENITEYSPGIYGIKALENIPAYVPYRRTNSIITRSENAVDSEEGVIWEMEDILDMLKKH